jgi:hypothetical protein
MVEELQQTTRLWLGKFEVFVALKMQIVVFCFVTSYSDVVGYQCFGGPCNIHLQEWSTTWIWLMEMAAWLSITEMIASDTAHTCWMQGLCFSKLLYQKYYYYISCTNSLWSKREVDSVDQCPQHKSNQTKVEGLGQHSHHRSNQYLPVSRKKGASAQEWKGRYILRFLKI